MKSDTAATRAEHLAWCKRRALAYLPDDPEQAFASMGSDLNKHEETRGHIGMQLGMAMLLSGNWGEMRSFIEGFN